MRTRKRAAFILASVAAFGVGMIAYAASAAAEPVIPACTYGAGHVGGADTGNKSCIKLQVTSNHAGNTFANRALGVRTRTLYQFPGNKPQGGFAKTVTLLFDNDFKVNFAAVPGNCTKADIANKTIPQAYAACGPTAANAAKRSYLSPANTISGRASTAPASNFGACTMVFKGPLNNQVLLYARVTTAVNSNPTCSTPSGSSPGNATVVLTGTIAAAGVTGFGQKLTVPGIDTLTLPLDDFYATVNKGSYFQARCPAGANPWKLRGTFVYSGTGQATDTYNTTQGCLNP